MTRRQFFAAAVACLMGIAATSRGPEPINTVPLTLNLSYDDFLTKYIESAIESIHHRGDECW